MNFEDYVNEALKVKYVVRKGKKVKKFKSTKDNYKVQYEDGKPKEVRITAKEKRNRKIARKKNKGKLDSPQAIKKKQLRRKKSFNARKMLGLAKYNKIIPDKNSAEKSSNKGFTKFAAKDKPLSPKFNDSFQDYITNSPLLLEWPQNLIYSTDDYEVYWDWCSEVTPEDGGWLWQLVKLYKYNHLDTLRNDRNHLTMEDGLFSDSHIEVLDKDKDQITKNLIDDYFFIDQAHTDLEFADEALISELQKWLPEDLFKRIMIGVRK